MIESFPIGPKGGRCRHCGELYLVGCPCGGAEGAAKREAAQDRAINETLAKDFGTPGRSEAALRRLGRAR